MLSNSITQHRRYILASLMTMPETAMDKYNGFVFREYQVRLARQYSIMKFIPEAFSEKELSDKDFRPCVFAPDP